MSFSCGVQMGMTKQRWSALWLAMLWLCVWAVPILHQVQCTDHHHHDTTCPICQMAATSIISSLPQTAPMAGIALAGDLPAARISFLHVELFGISLARGPPTQII